MTAGEPTDCGRDGSDRRADGRGDRRVSRRGLGSAAVGTALAGVASSGRAEAAVGDCTVVDPHGHERFAWVRDHPHRAERDDASLEATDLVPFGDGYLVGGAISRPVDPSPWLLAVDAEGRERWRRTYETGPYDTEGRAHVTGVAPLPDGGALAAVGIGAPAQAGPPARLYRIGAEGGKRDEVAVNADWLRTLRAAGDGVVAGGFVGREERSQPVVLALDADGSERWRTELSSPGEVTVVLPTGDGGYLVGVAGGQVAARLTADGDVDWEREYGSGAFYAGSRTADGRYRFAGIGPGGAGAVEIRPDGDPVWRRSYAFPDATDLAMATEGYAVVTGAHADSDGNVLQVTPDGRWSRCWGFADYTPGATTATGDGGVIIAGERFSGEIDAMGVMRFEVDADAGAARTATATETPADPGPQLPWGIGVLVAALVAVVGWVATRRSGDESE